MRKRRWDRKKKRMSLAKGRRVATRREERLDVYRDPETKLLLKVGPDHGTEERARQDGGIVLGSEAGKALGFAQTAWAVAPGALEHLHRDGGLLVGLLDHPDRWEVVRRWMEAAQFLRQLATRAGVQKRLTGRYDFGAQGRGEMSERTVEAFERLTALADRLTWSRLGPLLDLVLFDRLPAGLRRPACRQMPTEQDPEFPLYEQSVRRNPAFVEAMRKAVQEDERLLPGRTEVWEAACVEVQCLLELLADAFGLRGPKRAH